MKDENILERRCKYCDSPMHWTQSDYGCDMCLEIIKFVRKNPLAIQRIMAENVKRLRLEEPGA